MIDALIRNIECARGRELPKNVASSICAELSKVPEGKARQIVKTYARMPNPPANVYGYISESVEAALYESSKRKENEQRWSAASSEMMSGDLFAECIRCIMEIMEWHKAGLCKKNPEGTTVPMTVEEYKAAGCPKSWSPLIDDMMTGSIPAYYQDMQRPGSLHAFFKKYADMLINARSNAQRKPIEKKFDRSIEAAIV